MEGQQKGLSGWLHPKGRITTSNPALLGCSASGRNDGRFRRSEAHCAQEADENRPESEVHGGEQVIAYHRGIFSGLRPRKRAACLTYESVRAKATGQMLVILSAAKDLALVDMARSFAALRIDSHGTPQLLRPRPRTIEHERSALPSHARTAAQCDARHYSPTRSRTRRPSRRSRRP